MASGVGLIARREFVERGRSRVFLGVLIGSMLLIVAGMFALSLLGRTAPPATAELAGRAPDGLAEEVRRLADALDVDLVVRVSESEQQARAHVLAGAADAALIDGTTIVVAGAAPPGVEAVLRGAATATAREQVAADVGLTDAELEALLSPVDVVEEDISAAGPSDPADAVRSAAAFASVVVMFILVMAFGQFVGSAVVEEKQSRVAELVLAKVSTESMLVGKVLGIGGLGLVQLLILGLTYLAGLWAFGTDSAGLDLFRLGAPALAWLAVWFVLGYATYSFIFATMGATVSRLEDLQSLTYLPSVLMLPAYAVAAASVGGAAGPLLGPMSMIPLWSPMLMPFRMVGGDAPWWQVLAALLGTLAFIVLLVRAGARVYRGAALRMGGRVPLREAWRAG